MKARETVEPTVTASPAVAKNFFQINPRLKDTILRVAWFSILLGFAIEAILVVVALSAGKADGPRPFVADLAQKLSWSVIVCIGLALGKAVSELRDVSMSVAGFLAAPLGFTIATSLHKGASEVLSLAAGTPAGGPSPFLLGTLKALEYGFLGWYLGGLEKKPVKRARDYVMRGIAAGLIFGGMILYVISKSVPQPMAAADLVAKGINEFLFPVGCSLVIFASSALNRK